LITRRRFLGQTGMLAAGISVGKLPSRQPQLTTLDPDKLSPYGGSASHPSDRATQRNAAQPGGCIGETSLLPHGHAADRKQGAQRFAGHTHVGLWVVFTRTDLRDPKQPGIDRGRVNELPRRHFLPIDHTLHGAEAKLPEVRSVIHLLGGKTPPFMARPKSCPVTDIPGRR
jgi:spore coat protein A